MLALLLVNILIWGSAIASFRVHLPDSISLLVVPYTVGLRHAFDADHIAAIDNTMGSLQS